MPVNADEKQLITVSIGVVAFSIAAFVVLLSGINQAVFYVIAVIALLLGFYLSYNLSRQGREERQSRKPARGRKAR